MTASNTGPFSTTKKFYALDVFPYGVDRSGEFTREQAELLIRYGQAYKALADGSRKPQGDEEESFVKVVKGEKEPSSKHEKVWRVFCQKVQASRVVVGSLGVVIDSDDTYTDELMDDIA